MAATTKTVTISGQNIEGNTVELEIPMTGKKVTSSNNLNKFNIPNSSPTSNDFRKTKALNMNRIAVDIQLSKAKISDEFADKNHNGNGDRPDLSNKEDWINQLYKLYVSGEILDLKATNSDTHALTSEFSGYLANMDWQERSGSESSVYDVTIKMNDCVPMIQ